MNGLAAKHTGGLDLAGLGDLALMLDDPTTRMTVPHMFAIELIREDAANSRGQENPGFTDESIAELANSIRERGIKSPLSLRPDPENPGHYIINHGHRRFRAAVVAGLQEVPAFIDEQFDSFDQVVENLQRENLTAREIADFIGSQLATGTTVTEIAQRLGKSKAFVSQHAALLNLPEPVAEAFHSGHVRDVTLANELARAHKENPAAVEEALKASAGEGDGLAAKPITRKAVKQLREAGVSHSARAAMNVGQGLSTQNAQNRADARVANECLPPSWNQTFAAAVSRHLDADVVLSGQPGIALQLVITVDDRGALERVIDKLGLSSLLEQAV